MPGSAPLHIGIDVRNLTSPSITGIARVLLEMTAAMARRGPTFSFYWPDERRPSALDAIADAKHVTSTYRGSIGTVLWGLSALQRAVGRDAPDVFWGPAHRIPPLLPARIPAVVTIHDLVWHRYPETMTWQRCLADRVLMGAAVRRADRVTAVSKATANDIAEVFGRDDIDVVYPGARPFPTIDAGDLFARLKLTGRSYALFTGTLEPRKNLVRLLRAFDRARTACNADWHLVIAGGKGWRDDAIRATLEPLVDAGHVHVAGFVSDAELAALYAHARFLAMPSLYEGFGLPVVEAQQHAVPVIASNGGALPEVAGEGGLLVDPRDETQIATAIEQLFTRDDLHQRLSDAARTNAQRFSWDACADKMLDVFSAARAQVGSRFKSRS